MGNFSVNHYSRIEVNPKGADVLFVLDLAEIPTFELLQKWHLTSASPHADVEKSASREAREWIRHLRIRANGAPVTPQLQGATAVVADGAGNMPVIRVNAKLHLQASSGKLEYEDGTYPDRAGWKEIVVAADPGAGIQKATPAGQDRSQALSAYPQDPTLAPPQDLKAVVEWTGGPVEVTKKTAPAAETSAQAVAPAAAAPSIETPPAAAAALPVQTGAVPAEPNSSGTIQRGDFLSRSLHSKEIPIGLALLCIAAAFWFGALHALEPGHGKTMVAAYLVGSRGTKKHALLLGATVTFTHTISVFVLGFITMFLSQYIMPDKITKWLGILSGLTIVWIGGLLFYRRLQSLLHKAESHGHHHNHDHGHSHGHSHEHAHHSHSHAEEEHAHAHSHGIPHTHEHVHAVAHTHEPHTHATDTHEHGTQDHSHSHSHDEKHEHSHAHHHDHSHSHGLTHTHDGHTHSHVPEGEISMKSLIALGASGGLVPCPGALILLLSAISLGRPGLGLLLLLSFSLGLALVLMATGLLVLYAKNLFPERKRDGDGLVFKLLPVISAAVILVVGVVLTGNALGVIPVVRFFG